MIEEIQDSKLHSYLRRLIDTLPDQDKRNLRTIRYCGSRVISQNGLESGVFLVANDKTAKFVGLTSCKNPWICPSCGARVMSKHAMRIAAAIEALKAKNQKACMITFTIPHSRGMSCLETTEILLKAWKDFITHGNYNQNAKYYSRKTGQLIVSDKVLKDPFSTFAKEFGCTYRIRVGEFTHGQAGWHPHFHCLFWVDADKFKYLGKTSNKKYAKIIDDLQARWITLLKKHTLRTWNKLYPDNKENNKTRLNIMYSRLNEGSVPMYISVDDNGKVIEQKSSSYICGWGADKELTSNIENKATAKGHETPRQILIRAEKGDKEAEKLYVEYMLALKKLKIRRVQFAKGMKAIIDEYMATAKHAETMKKKAIDEAKANGIWKLVCWFNEKQWSEICLVEEYIKKPLQHEILKLALKANGAKLIENFLSSYDIKYDSNQRANSRVDIYANTFKFVA